MQLKIAYFGSPDFSAFVLQKILDELPDVEIVCVVTQPDRPTGRKHVTTPTSVKVLAQSKDIRVIESIAGNYIEYLKQCDFALVFAYGQIIPDELLSLPRNGFINIHPSLLPQFRGPSPLVFPILLGQQDTGVTLMHMDAQMDHGPIILQYNISIGPNNSHDQLLFKASERGFELFKQFVTNIHSVAPRAQNHHEATFTKLLKRDDGFVALTTIHKSLTNKALTQNELPQLIEWYFKKNKKENNLNLQDSGKIMFNLWRALHPWPGIWTIINNKRIKIIDADLKKDCFQIKTIQIEGEKQKPIPKDFFS